MSVKRKNKGQSTIEYILLAAAVIAVLVVFLRPNGPFSQAYNDALSDSSSSMNSMTGRITESYKD